MRIRFPMTQWRSPTSLPADRIEGWNKVIRGILTHAASTGPDLNTVLQVAPDFALGQAIRGLSCLLLGRAEMVSVARQAHLAALAGAPATPREAAFVEALGRLAGRAARAPPDPAASHAGRQPARRAGDEDGAGDPFRHGPSASDARLGRRSAGVLGRSPGVAQPPHEGCPAAFTLEENRRVRQRRACIGRRARVGRPR